MATTVQRRQSAATAGVLFAAAIMILNGMFQLFEGIIGVANNQLFVSTPNYVYQFSTFTWGVIHVALGSAIIAVGFWLLTGARAARPVAMVIIGLQAISNFFFLPYFPIWAVLIIAIDVWIIWSLATAPRREQERRM